MNDPNGSRAAIFAMTFGMFCRILDEVHAERSAESTHAETCDDLQNVRRQILAVYGFRPDRDPRNELETWTYESPDGRTVSVSLTAGENDEDGEPYDIAGYALSACTGYYATNKGEAWGTFVLDAKVAHSTPETI